MDFSSDLLFLNERICLKGKRNSIRIKRKQVWKIVLSGLSYPKGEEENKHASNKMRSLRNSALSIDCIDRIHGVALEITICYAFWVKRNLGLTQKTLSIEEATEIFSTLDRHLDLTIEK